MVNIALYEKCGRDTIGFIEEVNKMMDLFSELFNMFDDFGAFGSFGAPSSQQQVMQNSSKTCPVCGHTWADFTRTGRFGCGECYKTFSGGAEQVLRQIHSSSEHIGKVPSKSSTEIKMKRKLEELKRRLKEAVAAEDYETAAKLHSEIKAIEGGASK